MKHIYIIITVLVVVLVGFNVYAQVQKVDEKERSGVITVFSNDVILTDIRSNGSVNNSTLSSEEKAQQKFFQTRLVLTTEESYNERNIWKELWVEFTPVNSGSVMIILKGDYYPDVKENHHEVWVDNVKVVGDGAELKNGDFEEIDSNGNPVDWGWKGLKDNYSVDGSQANIGKACILIWHDFPISQPIFVKAGERYKASAWFKPYYKN